jgi:single-strand DNA-binding protein
MMNEPLFTGTGNLASDPELRYTATGIPVASFSLAMNPRIRGASGEWEDGTTVFLRITAWRDLAENVAASLRKGDPAMVHGKFRQRTWDDRETGQERRGDEVQADTVAVPLDRRIVKLTKVTRESPQEPGDSQETAEPGPEPGNGSQAGSGPRSGKRGREAPVS